MTRPIDFPPPFGDIDAIAPPSDPPDERIDVGILIVGAGPAPTTSTPTSIGSVSDGSAIASASDQGGG